MSFKNKVLVAFQTLKKKFTIGNSGWGFTSKY